MSHKKTNSQFIKDSREVHGEDTYDYPLTEYIDSHTKVKITCRKHGVFEQLPYAHVSLKQGCPKCGLEKRKHPGQKTTDEFKEQAIAKWCNEYDYTITEYINKHTKIKYECRKHGIIEQLPYLHLKHGCPYCNGRGIGKHTVDSFKEKAAKKHGFIYKYPELTELKSIFDEIFIECTLCGHKFTQRACNHFNNGCPKCNGGIKYTKEEFMDKANEKHGEKFRYPGEYVNSHIKMDIECSIHGEFEQLPYTHLSSIHGCPMCAAEASTSEGEDEVRKFIFDNYSKNILSNDRKMIYPLEIDILLPELGLGVEYNGNFFHTETFVGKDYHLKKSDAAESVGISLIQIYESEWKSKNAIVESRLLCKLGINKRIYARKTKIVELTLQEKNYFLGKTHIQGKDNSSIYYGLEYLGELVACMTFGKPRFDRNYDYELIRYSSALCTNVVGGASKLLNHFMKNYDGSIVTYADRRWSNGNMYFKLGFNMTGKSAPGYMYYNLNTKQTFSRIKFQKHKLRKMSFYEEEMSEYEIMKKNGFDRIWDSGQYRFVMSSSSLRSLGAL